MREALPDKTQSIILKQKGGSMEPCEYTYATGCGTFIFICIITAFGIMAILRLFRGRPENMVQNYQINQMLPERRDETNLFVVIFSFCIFVGFLIFFIK